MIMMFTCLCCRFARYYKLQEDGQIVQYRDLTKSYGVLFLINVQGEVCYSQYMQYSVVHV